MNELVKGASEIKQVFNFYFEAMIRFRT